MKIEELENEKIDIFGYKIKLKVPSSDQDAGEYDPENKTIGVERDTEGEEIEITLVHEMFHALCHRMSLIDAGICGAVEEMLANLIGKMVGENFELKFRKKPENID